MSILHLTKFYAEIDINHATKLNRHTLVKQESVWSALVYSDTFFFNWINSHFFFKKKSLQICFESRTSLRLAFNSYIHTKYTTVWSCVFTISQVSLKLLLITAFIFLLFIFFPEYSNLKTDIYEQGKEGSASRCGLLCTVLTCTAASEPNWINGITAFSFMFRFCLLH